MTNSFLIQIGRITVNFQFLEYSIRYAIKILSEKNQEFNQEDFFNSKTSFGHLISRLKQLSVQCEHPNELKELISEVTQIKDKRNDIIHSIWWANGDNIEREKENKFTEVKINDLKKMAKEIIAVQYKINSFLENY